jgi:nitrogen fixation protein NifU and related proteins
MATLSALYQDLILDHNRAPQNFRRMADANRQAEGYNPLCGDRLSVSIRFEDDRVMDVAFQGSGCAISKASASLMTSAIKGKTRGEVEALFDRFRQLVSGSLNQAEAQSLGKLVVFSGLSEFPSRVKCASLSWHAMKAALDQPGETVTTDIEA